MGSSVVDKVRGRGGVSKKEGERKGNRMCR